MITLSDVDLMKVVQRSQEIPSAVRQSKVNNVLIIKYGGIL